MATAVRRLLLLDRAKDCIGGAEKLGAVIGVGRRAMTHKIAGDRSIDDFDYRLISDAIERRAVELHAAAAAADQLVVDMRELIGK
jgi:hypothetical protein